MQLISKTHVLLLVSESLTFILIQPHNINTFSNLKYLFSLKLKKMTMQKNRGN